MGGRPDFMQQAMPKTPLPGLAWEALAPLGVKSLYEPFAGLGANLYAFKRNGVRVLGSELLESTTGASRALNANNATRLSPEAIARFSAATPPTLAAYPRFSPWVERHFFDEAQAAHLGYWREQLEALSGYERDLALVAVAWMIDNWIKRLEQPGTPSASPSALSLYLKRANQWVWDNGASNDVRRGAPIAVAPSVQADACYLYLEPPLVAIDLRSWLLEAWFQGEPEADLSAFYRDNPFYAPADEYRQGVEALFASLQHIPIWAIQYRTEELDALWGDHPSWLSGRELVAQQHLGMGEGAEGEMLLVAVHS
ncbi:MAG TPA: hypothetical protein V6D00_05150 [Pantanalinema sp.]